MTNDPSDQTVNTYKFSDQTANYITLKPLAEKFNRVAANITDDEIKSIIKSEIIEQLKRIDFSGEINDIIDEYIDKNSDEVLEMYKTGLKNRLS